MEGLIMRPRWWAVIALALASVGGVALAAEGGFSLKTSPKIAFIYYSPRNTGGWTQSFEEARPKIEAALDQKIAFVESVPEDAAEIRPAAEKFMQRGYDIILGTAFGYSDAFKELAAKHPETAFINAAGTTNGPNLQSVYGRTYQSYYLCGMVAGAMSKSGKLGYVAPNPFGLVNWTINAWTLGAQKMNPKATVTVVYTGSWNDPVKERTAALALIDSGADVLSQHTDTPTVQIVAEEKGVYGTGYERDMREFAPKATLCSQVWQWDKFLVPEIKKIVAGGWQPAPYGAFPGIKQGGTDIACCNTVVPKEIVDRVTAERDAIIEGKEVFQGPILDNGGKERVASGQVVGDADLWKMDWYVAGVTAAK
jgi:basic membrane lipoprotein Med (substrate-binding protein (PBP1-ABC) superfamily)